MSPLEIFFSAPPISRTIAAVTFTFSLLIYTGLLPYHLFNLEVAALTQLPPQLWRIFTSLFMTGGRVGILFDTYFLFVYGGKLEIASPRFTQRADFITYICFVSCVILLLNLLIIFGNALAPALALSFVTTYTRDAWDQPMTFIVLKMPTKYLPCAMIFTTFILCGPHGAMIEATGFVAAHLYNLFTGLHPNFGIKRNLITTPGWLKKMFGTQTVVERPYGTVSMPGVAGEAAWGLDMSWKRFGPGRTLGGEGSSVERQRPSALLLAAMVMGGLVVVCLLLGYFFVLHGVPDGWLASGTSWFGDKTPVTNIPK